MDMSEFWPEFGRVAAAALLCALIGLERQFRQKNAGVHTHALVGMGACLFTIIGMHPWVGAASPTGEEFRVAAQVVSGIGFLGAGVIFVNRDFVHGLTTAAGIWLSAAVGMACGARMIPLAAGATLLYLFFILALNPLVTRIPTRDRHMVVRLVYVEGEGTLRRIITTASQMQFEASVVSTHQVRTSTPSTVSAVIRFQGGVPLQDLVAEISEIPGVESADVVGDSRSPED